ncbi:tRNA lysidine(34) synthetase TilS [Flagellatimonas centrodinii]|uniref:tRNA lysidine(34) synthetase TilS n=1 Tax=Flagellatimonas centrodinii TaxID=2806210 RepID=UPI001FEDFEFD|nr:tRNA lysidine(34) synthetase TilS [Flagellatimonas centrodinii]ULQ46131.1 tRNA lysidine(34) synthetase TilS [Flagellatimonas centrodinii]
MRLPLPSAPTPGAWVVAYSGGRDSTVLLHALWSTGQPLRAVHVHHGLQPAADSFAHHCRQTCKALGIALDVRHVAVCRDGSGPEAAARTARYAALSAALGDDDLLITAHHAQDQVETLLARLLRGSGLDGLGGIAHYRTSPSGRGVWRPLLDCWPAQLAAYAVHHDLRWVDDPHNADPRFQRVWLRQTVLPMLSSRHPGVASTLSDLAAEVRATAPMRKARDAALRHQCERPGPWGTALLIPRLLALPRVDQQRVLRAWWAAQGGAPPGAAAVASVLDEVVPARADGQPALQIGPDTLRRYRQCLYRDRSWSPPAAQTWRDGRELSVPGLGRWQAAQAPTRPLQLAFPCGGERILPAGEVHHRRLKQLFQQHGVPPWQRPRTPLLLAEGRLVAVAGVAVAADAPMALKWIEHADDAVTT